MRDENRQVQVKAKAQYTAPTLTVQGTLESITRSAATGGFLDADFAAGTPIGDVTVTFS